MIWQAVEAVFVIFLMIAAGIFVSWRKWVGRDASKIFPKIIINIAVPCMLISSLTTHFTQEQLFSSWLPLLIVFVVVPSTFFLGRLVAKVFRIPKQRRGIFTILFAFSNSVFIGFPVALALFGEAGMPYAIFYYLANTTFFWLLGYYVIRKDADQISGKHSKLSARETVLKLVTPPIITIITMFIVILLDIKLPSIILTTAKYIGGLTSPLSLIFMGCMIYNIGFSGMKYEKGIGLVLLGRFLLIPGICFAACMLAIAFLSPQGMSADLMLMRNVFTVQIGLPVMTQSVIVSELYGADTNYATKNVVWTTVFSLLSIPAYMILFQFI